MKMPKYLGAWYLVPEKCRWSKDVTGWQKGANYTDAALTLVFGCWGGSEILVKGYTFADKNHFIRLFIPKGKLRSTKAHVKSAGSIIEYVKQIQGAT